MLLSEAFSRLTVHYMQVPWRNRSSCSIATADANGGTLRCGMNFLILGIQSTAYVWFSVSSIEIVAVGAEIVPSIRQRWVAYKGIREANSF